MSVGVPGGSLLGTQEGGSSFVQGEVKSGFFIVEYKVVGKYELGFWGNFVGFVVVACAHYCVGSAVVAAVEIHPEGSCGSCVAHKWKITVIWVTDVTHQVGWATRDRYGYAMEVTKISRGIPPWSSVGTLLGQQTRACTQAG